MNDKNKHKKNINPMTHYSDGLTITARQIVESKVLEDKLQDVTPEVLATLVLAETTKGDESKQKRASGRSRLFYYLFGIELLSLVCGLIEDIVGVVRSFM